MAISASAHKFIHTYNLHIHSNTIIEYINKQLRNTTYNDVTQCLVATTTLNFSDPVNTFYPTMITILFLSQDFVHLF